MRSLRKDVLRLSYQRSRKTIRNFGQYAVVMHARR
jgi:hypothetical protein